MVRYVDIIALVTLTVVLAAPLHSQTVRGVVLDDSTSAPIASAEVTLLDTLGHKAAQMLSDSAGRFLFEVEPGQYTFRVRRIGYAPTVTRACEVLEGGGEMNVVIKVPPASALEGDVPYALAPLVVVGEVTERHLAAFYRHQAVGLGDFVLREEFEKWRPHEITDIVRRMPSFSVTVNKYFGRALPDGTIDTRQVVIDITTRPHRNPAECPPLIFLDGAPIGNTQTVDIDLLMLDAIGAVETYSRPAQIPPEYNRTGGECGVIGLWTRAPELGETASPFELGIRYRGTLSGGDLARLRLGFHVITPFIGPLEFYAALHFIGNSGWDAQLAARLTAVSQRFLLYVGTGLLLVKDSPGDVLGDLGDIDPAHTIFAGSALRLGLVRPFAEIHVLDVFNFSDLNGQALVGFGVRF